MKQLLATAITILILSACGNSDDNKNSTETGSDTSRPSERISRNQDANMTGTDSSSRNNSSSGTDTMRSSTGSDTGRPQ